MGKGISYQQRTVVQSKSSTVPGKVASAGNGDAVRAAQQVKHVPYGTPAQRVESRAAVRAQERAFADKGQRAPRSGSFREARIASEKSGGGGGQGRGNWGHAGRPGQRGGSA